MGRLLGILIALILFVVCIKTLKKMKKIEKPKNTFRAEELESLNAPGVTKTINIDAYIEGNCKQCVFFDGYDVCCCSKHWGTVIQNTVDYCYRDGNFRKNYTVID